MVPIAPALSYRPTVRRPISLCSTQAATRRASPKNESLLEALLMAELPKGVKYVVAEKLPSSLSWLTRLDADVPSPSIMISKPNFNHGVAAASPRKLKRDDVLMLSMP
jgi:hypothetical protein